MLRIAGQVVFLALVVALVAYLYGNLIGNLGRRNIRTDLRFLYQPAGFRITGSDFESSQPNWMAILVGLRNTLYVSLIGIALATLLGVIVGVLRLSTNWIVRRSAAAYVEAFRNVPLLVLILFLYLAALPVFPPVGRAAEWLGSFVVSRDGVWVPWYRTAPGAGALMIAVVAAAGVAILVAGWRTRRFTATGAPHHRMAWAAGAFVLVAGVAWLVLGRPVVPSFPAQEERAVTGGLRLTLEYGALLVALVVYISAFIAEIVRGAIQAVPKGQTEAAGAVGLRAFQRLRLVILPQAMRIAVPPTGNEFLNLTKNSSLGIAIAFPELLRVTRIVIGNGHPAPQAVGLMMGIYLLISLTLSGGTNVVNRWVHRRGF